MRITLATLLVLLVVIFVAYPNAADDAPKKSSGKKATTSKKTGKKASSKSRKGKGGQAWRTRQLQPSPERYREIQQALAAKGYLKGESTTGAWDQESTDALRRFQEDQSLAPTGKIDSLSLIALGLGPKYDTTAIAPARSPQP